MTCDKCGVDLSPGDWPWCPHGRGASSVVGDDIPGGQMFENGFPTPQKFYSKSAHRNALAEKGLEIAAKNAGPNDKICPRWDSVDLDGARALLESCEQARAEKRQQRDAATAPEDPFGEFPITVTDLHFEKPK